MATTTATTTTGDSTQTRVIRVTQASTNKSRDVIVSRTSDANFQDKLRSLFSLSTVATTGAASNSENSTRGGGGEEITKIIDLNQRDLTNLCLTERDFFLDGTECLVFFTRPSPSPPPSASTSTSTSTSAVAPVTSSAQAQSQPTTSVTMTMDESQDVAQGQLNPVDAIPIDINMELPIIPSTNILTKGGDEYDLYTALAELIDNSIQHTKFNLLASKLYQVASSLGGVPGGEYDYFQSPFESWLLQRRKKRIIDIRLLTRQANPITTTSASTSPTEKYLVVCDNGLGMNWEGIRNWATMGVTTPPSSNTTISSIIQNVMGMSSSIMKPKKLFSHVAGLDAEDEVEDDDDVTVLDAPPPTASGPIANRGKQIRMEFEEQQSHMRQKLDIQCKTIAQEFIAQEQKNVQSIMLNSDFSRYGLGSKKAIFNIGNKVTFITKVKDSPVIYECTLSRSELEKASLASSLEGSSGRVENSWKAPFRVRNIQHLSNLATSSGEANSALSADEVRNNNDLLQILSQYFAFTPPNSGAPIEFSPPHRHPPASSSSLSVIRDWSFLQMESFSFVKIEQLQPHYVADFDPRVLCEKLGHIYHFYIYGPGGRQPPQSREINERAPTHREAASAAAAAASAKEWENRVDLRIGGVSIPDYYDPNFWTGQGSAAPDPTSITSSTPPPHNIPPSVLSQMGYPDYESILFKFAAPSPLKFTCKLNIPAQQQQQQQQQQQSAPLLSSPSAAGRPNGAQEAAADGAKSSEKKAPKKKRQTLEITGIIHYFPFKEGRETLPVPPELLENKHYSPSLLTHGGSLPSEIEDNPISLKERKPGLEIFWNGRLIPNEAPRILSWMKPTTDPKRAISPHVWSRVKGMLFLDSNFEVTANKMHLVESSKLNRQVFGPEKSPLTSHDDSSSDEIPVISVSEHRRLTKLFREWVKSCHKYFDEEIVFGPLDPEKSHSDPRSTEGRHSYLHVQLAGSRIIRKNDFVELNTRPRKIGQIVEIFRDSSGENSNICFIKMTDLMVIFSQNKKTADSSSSRVVAPESMIDMYPVLKISKVFSSKAEAEASVIELHKKSSHRIDIVDTPGLKPNTTLARPPAHGTADDYSKLLAYLSIAIFPSSETNPVTFKKLNTPLWVSMTFTPLDALLAPSGTENGPHQPRTQSKNAASRSSKTTKKPTKSASKKKVTAQASSSKAPSSTKRRPSRGSDDDAMNDDDDNEDMNTDNESVAESDSLSNDDEDEEGPKGSIRWGYSCNRPYKDTGVYCFEFGKWKPRPFKKAGRYNIQFRCDFNNETLFNTFSIDIAPGKPHSFNVDFQSENFLFDQPLSIDDQVPTWKIELLDVHQNRIVFPLPSDFASSVAVSRPPPITIEALDDSVLESPSGKNIPAPSINVEWNSKHNLYRVEGLSIRSANLKDGPGQAPKPFFLRIAHASSPSSSSNDSLPEPLECGLKLVPGKPHQVDVKLNPPISSTELVVKDGEPLNRAISFSVRDRWNNPIKDSNLAFTVACNYLEGSPRNFTLNLIPANTLQFRKSPEERRKSLIERTQNDNPPQRTTYPLTFSVPGCLSVKTLDVVIEPGLSPAALDFRPLSNPASGEKTSFQWTRELRTTNFTGEAGSELFVNWKMLVLNEAGDVIPFNGRALFGWSEDSDIKIVNGSCSIPNLVVPASKSKQFSHTINLIPQSGDKPVFTEKVVVTKTKGSPSHFRITNFKKIANKGILNLREFSLNIQICDRHGNVLSREDLASQKQLTKISPQLLFLRQLPDKFSELPDSIKKDLSSISSQDLGSPLLVDRVEKVDRDKWQVSTRTHKNGEEITEMSKIKIAGRVGKLIIIVFDASGVVPLPSTLWGDLSEANLGVGQCELLPGDPSSLWINGEQRLSYAVVNYGVLPPLNITLRDDHGNIYIDDSHPEFEISPPPELNIRDVVQSASQMVLENDKGVFKGISLLANLRKFAFSNSPNEALDILGTYKVNVSSKQPKTEPAVVTITLKANPNLARYLRVWQVNTNNKMLTYPGCPQTLNFCGGICTGDPLPADCVLRVEILGEDLSRAIVEDRHRPMLTLSLKHETKNEVFTCEGIFNPAIQAIEFPKLAEFRTTTAGVYDVSIIVNSSTTELGKYLTEEDVHADIFIGRINLNPGPPHHLDLSARFAGFSIPSIVGNTDSTRTLFSGLEVAVFDQFENQIQESCEGLIVRLSVKSAGDVAPDFDKTKDLPCLETDTDPSSARNGLPYIESRITGGVARFGKVAVTPNTGKNGQYALVFSCTAELKTKEIQFSFLNDADHVEQRRNLEQKRDQLQGSIRTLEKIINDARKVFDGESRKAAEANEETYKWMNEQILPLNIPKVDWKTKDSAEVKRIFETIEARAQKKRSDERAIWTNPQRERENRIIEEILATRDHEGASSGILGIMAELGMVSDKRQNEILSRTLGSNMRTILFRDNKTMNHWKERLRSEQTILISFLSLELIHLQSSLILPPISAPGFKGYACDLIRVSPSPDEHAIRQVFHMLSSRALVFDTIQNGVAYRTDRVKTGHCDLIVSLDGERLESTGITYAGSKPPQDFGYRFGSLDNSPELLKKLQRFQELLLRKEEAEKKKADAEQALKTARDVNTPKLHGWHQQVAEIETELRALRSSIPQQQQQQQQVVSPATRSKRKEPPEEPENGNPHSDDQVVPPRKRTRGR